MIQVKGGILKYPEKNKKQKNLHVVSKIRANVVPLVEITPWCSSSDPSALQTTNTTSCSPQNNNAEGSVQFSSLTNWVVGGTCGMIWQRSSSSLFYRRSSWAVLAQAGMTTLRCCPSSIPSAGHVVAHPPSWPEEWFWRGCHGVWHAKTMQVSISWHLPEQVPMDPQGSWSCSAPSRWFNAAGVTDDSFKFCSILTHSQIIVLHALEGLHHLHAEAHTVIKCQHTTNSAVKES